MAWWPVGGCVTLVGHMLGLTRCCGFRLGRDFAVINEALGAVRILRDNHRVDWFGPHANQTSRIVAN
jgi:hypothetical protein